MPSSLAERIVFDLDDTLYLERDFAFSGYRAAGDWLEARGAVPPGLGTRFAGACRELFARGERRAIFDRAAQELGLDPELVPDLIELYRSHMPRIGLCPDAVRYLTGHRGFALISDGVEQTQRNKIAALGLQAHFDLVLPTGQWGTGYGKPHPRAYELVAAASGGRTCVYVADNAAKDFLAPNRMGWITVQILRPGRVHEGSPPTPDHAAGAVIGSLDQLDQAIAALRG